MRRLGLTGLLAVALAGCASRAPILATSLAHDTRPSQMELRGTPFFPQQQYQCGPAALATVLSASGVPVTANELVPLVYIPKKRGSLQVEILAASRRYGRIPYVITPSLQALTTELRTGRPVLVLQNLGLDAYPLWHYAVVIGYSVERDEIILRSGITQRQVMSARRFLDTWQRGDRWGLVVLPPGELPAQAKERDYLSAVAAMDTIAEPDELLPAYRAALGRWPDSDLALFGTAGNLHRLGDLAGAEAAYRRLLAHQPAHVAALNNLAEVLADRGCYALAVDTIDHAAETHAGDLREALIRTRIEILERQRQAGRDAEDCGIPLLPTERARVK